MAGSCRTSRKGRTPLSRGSLAKTSATVRTAEVNTIRSCYDAAHRWRSGDTQDPRLRRRRMHQAPAETRLKPGFSIREG